MNLLTQALSAAFGDLLYGFGLAIVGAVVAALLVGAEGLYERRKTRRVKVPPFDYRGALTCIGQPPLGRHRVGIDKPRRRAA